MGRVSRLWGPPDVSRGALALIGLVLFAQVSLLVVYLTAFDTRLAAFHLYPIVWITVSCWVIWHARPPTAGTRRHLAAATVAVLYLLLIGYLGGLYSPGSGLARAPFVSGIRVEAAAPPGYAPAFFYVGTYVTVAVIPYLTVGYLTLAYLVYVTILDAWAATAPGVIGIFGCIGCSWPVLASLVAGAGGASGSVAAAVYANAYPLSTIAFLLAVGLLYWRPTADTLRQLRPR